MLKTCKVCGETKEAVQGVWKMKHGKPSGRVCQSCTNASQLEKQRSLVTLPTGEVVTYSTAANRKNRSTPEGLLKARMASIEHNRQRHARTLLSGAKSTQHNPKVHAATRAWYAALLRQTPHWVTGEMLDQMDALYAARKKGECVDHKVPLVGKDLDGNHIVSGLNVPWNLQIIPRGSNSRKGSYFHQV